MSILQRIPVDDISRLAYTYMCCLSTLCHLFVNFEVDHMFPLHLKDGCFMRLHDVAFFVIFSITCGSIPPAL